MKVGRGSKRKASGSSSSAEVIRARVAGRNGLACLKIPTKTKVKKADGREGFAIAPILYMLTLVGVGAGIMFSSYSQVLRSGIQVTNSVGVRSDLNSASTTLSALSVTVSSTVNGQSVNILCPPGGGGASGDCTASANYASGLAAFSSATASKLPSGCTTAGCAGFNTGSPTEMGVLSVAGAKQLDSWGHYYIYCRWENPVASAGSPSIAIISAGQDGVLNTHCGDGAAQGDDQATFVNVAQAITKASVWQQTASGAVYGSSASGQVRADTNGTVEAVHLMVSDTSTLNSLQVPNAASLGSLQVSGAATANSLSLNNTLSVVNAATMGSLSLGTPLPLTSGGTFSTTASGARSNLGSGAVGDQLFTSATAQAARNVLGSAGVGDALFTTATPLAARVLLGSTASTVGDLMFTATNSSDVLSILGAGGIGRSLFYETDQSAARTEIGGGTVGSSLFTAPTIAAAWNTLGLTATNGASINVSTSGTASNVTGIVAIGNGGTNASNATDALHNLGGDNASNLTMGTLASALLPSVDSTFPSSGWYNSVMVDTRGRVTSAAYVAASGITDNVGDQVSLTSTSPGWIYFMTASVNQMALSPAGDLGIGMLTPAVRLQVYDTGTPAIRISGPAATSRELQFATGTNSERWTLITSTASESGSNAGSNFQINSFSDGGTYLATPLTITRSTGNATFSGAVTANGGFNGSGAGLTNLLMSSLTGTLPISSGGTGTNTAFTQGSVVYTGTGGAYAQDNGNFFWDATNHRLGIGTASPRSSLDIGGDTDALIMPSGNTSQRPTGVNGMVRYNTDGNVLEAYQNSSWASLLSVLGGSAAVTAPQRAGDPGTGLFSDAASTVEISAGGTKILSVNGSSVVNLTGTVTAGTGNLSYQINGDNAIWQDVANYNTAVGKTAMPTTVSQTGTNSTGLWDTAVGYRALDADTTGSSNVAVGSYTMIANQTGQNNVAIGHTALESTGTSSSYNTAVGSQALPSIVGNYNTAVGRAAGYLITSGSSNLLLGEGAGWNNGTGSLTSGSSNILIGANVTTTAATSSNQLNIGNAIYGTNILPSSGSAAGRVQVRSPVLGL